MLVIQLRFLAGRYHANPWGRHVNEGQGEWPPSPYRLVRALYDAWKRKRPEWPSARVEPLFATLSSEPPVYSLASAAFSHTRSYLSTNQEDWSKKTLIFDGFAALGPSARVHMGWPRASLTPEQNRDLGELLSTLNFLGRSESWVEAELHSGDAPEWNCVPAGAAGHTVPVACPVQPEQYQPPSLAGGRRRGKKPPSPQFLTWLEALAFSTQDLIDTRLSNPPAMRFVEYALPRREHTRVVRSANTNRAHGLICAIESRVRPLVTETIRIAERFRINLMGAHKRIVGDPSRVSPRFSGKDPSGRPLRSHQHVYLLPFDQDLDGRIDSLFVYSRHPLDGDEQVALDRVEPLVWSDPKFPLHCVPVKWIYSPADRLVRSTMFESSTPFVPTRHYRRGRGAWSDWIRSEILRECRNHGIEEPADVQPLPHLEIRGGRPVHWLEFRRARSSKADPPKTGYGFRLTFENPVPGPFALGYGSHFGLGQFWPCTVEISRRLCETAT